MRTTSAVGIVITFLACAAGAPASAENFPGDSVTRWAIPPDLGKSNTEVSCGTYVKANEGIPLGKSKFLVGPDGITYFSENLLLENWISGMVAGVNMAFPGATKQVLTDQAARTLWIRNYCATRPTDSLMHATFMFIGANLQSQFE